MRRVTDPTRRRHSNVPAGFSLLELVVIATVGSILFLLLLRWILGLGAIANDSVSAALSSTNASYASALLASDFASARPCVNGSGQALVELTPTSVKFFAITQRPDAAAELSVFASQNAMSLITWSVDNSGSLTRFVEPVDPVSCSVETSRSPVTVAAPVYYGPDNSPTTKFLPLIAGQVVDGECTLVETEGAATFGSGPACAATAVKVFFTFLTPGAQPDSPEQWGPEVSPVIVERSYALGNQKGL